ncbi:MAG: hypothetical protein GXP09_06275 [Gammaproteobacteria bacterium]|nr:hypothetical protein [Gammaproteobacteria bacterium]
MKLPLQLTRTGPIGLLGVVVLTTYLIGVSVVLAAPENRPAKKPVTNADLITLNFQNADIRALIATVSQLTGKNFIVDPRVKGKVTLISGDKLNINQVYNVFLSVLSVHNFAAVDTEDGVTKIVPVSIVKQSPTPTSFSVPKPLGDVFVTQVYQVKYGAVQDMVPILRPLLPPTSHFAAYASSNTLVFTATTANVRRVLKVLEQIDQPAKGSDINVVYLKYAKAVDMVKILNGVLKERQKGAPKKTKLATLNVQGDEATNALVIQAPKGDFPFIKEVIDKLDIRRAQVFIEVLIAEVSMDKAQDVGVRWEFGDDNIVNGQTTGNTGFSDVTGGLTLGYLKSFVTDLGGNLIPELQVVLSALRTDTNTNILSTPTLLTLDNETAEIVVGQEVPFVTGQFTNTPVTSTVTAPTTGTPTTSVNPFQTIQRKKVGLKLKITPQINQDRSLSLNIEQEISSISAKKIEGASDLITNTRSIKATVMVDDSRIIVLGGLMTDDLQDTIEWVPILGKIPLLGALFRKKSKKAVKTNLLMFLKPKIIRSQADLDGYTSEKYKYMRELEKNSNPDSKYLLYGSKSPVLPKQEKHFSGEKLGPEVVEAVEAVEEADEEI